MKVKEPTRQKVGGRWPGRRMSKYKSPEAEKGLTFPITFKL